MAKHSKIGASSMHRWSKCPGSVRLCENIPSTTSSYAEEGTKAHEIAAEVLLRNQWPTNIDREMKEAISVYTEAVKAAFVGQAGKMWVEHKFDLSSVHPGLYGTADAIVFQEDQKLLKVFDYKHGAGVAVDVKDNVQLLYYGLGALLTTGVKAKEVELVIVQPRCPHPDGIIRTWRFPSIELLDFAADLAQFAKATEDSNAVLNPGEHCRFCPAAGICPELNKQAVIAAQEEFRSDLSYSPEKLSVALKALPMIEAWIKAVREFSYQEALHGRIPPDFKLVQKRATRKWSDEKKLVSWLKRSVKLSDEDIYEQSLLSPAQMEKHLKTKEQKTKMSEFTKSESSGFVLAHESDKRPAAKADPKSEFSKIGEIEFLE